MSAQQELLFDFDVTPVEVEEKRRVTRARAPKPKPELLPGLEDPPPEAPAWNWRLLEHPGRLEDVAQRIRPVNQPGGEFRLDCVAQTAVLMVEQQLSLRCGVTPGHMLHERLDDDELAATWRWFQWQITWMHPWLFPSWPEWPVDHLRRWIRVWWGVDMIGAHDTMHQDVIALAFQHSASMSGKQNGWGAFYTPFNLCLMMAEMLADEAPWRATFCEPSVGAGSMVVAQFMVVRNRLIDAQKAGIVLPEEVPALVKQWVARVSATDIDIEACWTTAVNLGVRTGYTNRFEHPYRKPVEPADASASVGT